jgi:FkbM family methyltransferase
MARGGIGRDHVVWAYRILLDREPESEAAVLGKLVHRTTRDLRGEFLSSPEYRTKNSSTIPYSTERNIVIKELDQGLRLFVDLSDCVIGLNIIRGSYERSEVSFVQRTVKPGQNTVDLGANIGLFTLVMASLVGEAGTVYAFEPLDRNAALLERSIVENGFEDRVTVTRSVVGQSSCSARLLFSEPSLDSGGAHLFTDRMSVPAGHRIAEVGMVDLDHADLRRPIDFIKLDIEGAEPLALLGAERILRADRPILLSEINSAALDKVARVTPAQYISQLRGHGYDCYALENGKLGTRLADLRTPCVQSVVFLPREM